MLSVKEASLKSIAFLFRGLAFSLFVGFPALIVLVIHILLPFLFTRLGKNYKGVKSHVNDFVIFDVGHAEAVMLAVTVS
jgi:uncharacterized membrane protein